MDTERSGVEKMTFMDKKACQNYVCFETISIVDAMKLIDKNSVGLLYVVDVEGKLVGCLTDGDIRRKIIESGDLFWTVKDTMNRDPIFINDSYDDNVSEKMADLHIYSIPIVNDDMFIQGIYFLKSYMKLCTTPNKNALHEIPVVIMAGGKGTRLYPYTKILPKPLIPIGDVPILERILDKFFQYGVSDFYITVNYRKEMIKAYFSESMHSYHIHYIDETEPLGTAGSISYIDVKFCNPIIVTNCDILIEEDFGKIIDYHRKSNNDMTIVSSLKNVVIPYGVLHMGEHGIVMSMEEKPQITNFINTGMYIINPNYLEWIPKNTFFHMTQLTEMLIKSGKQVGMYPVSEDSFLDMGEFEEMKKMEERLN